MKTWLDKVGVEELERPAQAYELYYLGDFFRSNDQIIQVRTVTPLAKAVVQKRNREPYIYNQTGESVTVIDLKLQDHVITAERSNSQHSRCNSETITYTCIQCSEIFSI